MPYICVKQSPRYKQLSFEDILLGEIDVSNLVIPNISNTRTYFTKKDLNEELLKQYNVDNMIRILENFNLKYQYIREELPREALYHSFKIPKRSGGLRNIDQPNEELMTALRELRDIFKNEFHLLYHTSAFAYVEKRSTKQAVQKHQQNNSKWYAKLDFSNFFSSTTPEFLYNMISLIFPVNEIVKDKKGEKELRKALELCFFNGGLPQGTPISPFLTNVMMIPIDHTIFNRLGQKHNYEADVDVLHNYIRNKDFQLALDFIKNINTPLHRLKSEFVANIDTVEDILKSIIMKKEKLGSNKDDIENIIKDIDMLTKQLYLRFDEINSNSDFLNENTFIYTRYADDMIISSKRDFNIHYLEEFIMGVLNYYRAPFSLNTKKTRYGSSSGRNWILGVMLNKDNQITIGHKKKKQFKAMVNNYIVDKKNHNNWSLSDVQHLSGIFSYYKMIEPDCIKHIIDEFNKKYNVDFNMMIKQDLKRLV